MTELSELAQHLETFVDVASSPTQQAASLEALASAVEKNSLSMEKLVREMELYLTTTDNVVRARGILLLAEVLKHLEAKPLDSAIIHSLTGFFAERLADWRALRGALVGCLALLRRKGTIGVVSATDADAVANSFLQNLQVQSLAQHDRKLCFELLECLLEWYPEAVKSMGDMLVYGTCEAIDGEKDPRCLMVAFHVIELLTQVFPDPCSPVASNAADIFDVMGCYFPLHFTHAKEEGAGVERDTLSRALMLAFSSTPLFEPFAIPLLLEKLSSSLAIAKVDSLKYLEDCALKYGANRMAKHYGGLWSSLKETIYSSTEMHLSFAPECLTGPGSQENEIQKEALNLLQRLVMQDMSFLRFVVDDIDVETVFGTISRCPQFKEMPEESKLKVLAISQILSVSAKASAPSCNKLYEIFFLRILNTLGILEKNSKGVYIPKEDSIVSGRLHHGGLYLCIGLLEASKDLILSSKEILAPSSCGHETWCSMVNGSSHSLIQVFTSAVAGSNEYNGVAYAYLGVKGLLNLGMICGGSSLLSKSIFEKVLITLTSLITAECGKTLAWKLALKALVCIGSFIDRHHETEKALSYMDTVVDKFVLLACSDHFGMPYSLVLEATSDICLTGPKHVQKIVQGFEEALCANLSEICVRGNPRSIENCVHLLDCFSNKVLPRVVEIDGFEDILLQFAVSIWNQIETCRVFDFRVGKELIDAAMMAMRQVVAISSVENQNTIIEKAYSVVSSSNLPLMESFPSEPVALEALQHDMSIRDELILSLFASAVMAVCPTSYIPNLKSVIHLFLVTLLRGHLPAAQALGSMVNKLGSGFSGTKISSTCSLEEAYDIIFHTTFAVGKNISSDGSGEISCGSEINLTKLCFGVYDGMNFQYHAITGVAWIGKGLLMGGDKRVSDITLVLLDCLKATNSSGQVLHSSTMRYAADAFHILMCDSDISLSRKFHAVIRPLYKQWFFSKMFPVLESSIMKSDTLLPSFLGLVSVVTLRKIPTMAKKDDFSCKKIAPKIGVDRANHNRDKLTSSFDLVEQMQFLYIEIIRVINCPTNPRTRTCFPFIELTLGNYRASTKTLPAGPNMEWNQVFAFDKTKGDVLEAVLKDGQFPENPILGKRAFKLVVDIPTRVPPDARIAPQWYTFPNSRDDNPDAEVELLMSVWFGTQADEVYSVAWFSDASGMSADCVINMRPKVYLAPQLCYVRVHIISAHDLIPTDGKRKPEIYVKAVLGQVALKTKVSSGLNPSWNQDLIFVAADPLDDTVFISLMDRLDDEHEECIGKLEKKLSDMVALKGIGVAPARFYDIEPSVNIEPVGKKNFSSKIRMKLSTDQVYHVFDESSHCCSDYRPFAKGLWTAQLGTLEIGILGATGLQPMKMWKDGKKSTDAYVVAKYGNKWIRTRTVVDSFSPKWNEQFTWEVYDLYTVVTLGIYDNCQVFGSNQPAKDVRIGKVKIRLSLLRSSKIYTYSFPIIDLGRDGLQKMGEIQLAVRLNCPAMYKYNLIKSYFSWLLPRAHYKSPLSILQIENLRQQAIQKTRLNLARMEPPLRSEVVQDILHAGAHRWSMRKAKANFDRLCKVLEGFLAAYTWLNNQRTSTEWMMKVVIVVVCGLLLHNPEVIPLLAVFGCIILILRNFIYNRQNDPFAIDAKLCKLDSLHPDELDEEFDTFPSSVTDINVLRMRYDRLRKMMERVTALMGDLASQGERICALVTWRDERATCYFLIICVLGFFVIRFLLTAIQIRWVLLIWVVWYMKFPCLRNDLLSAPINFFRRLPTREDTLI